MKSETYTCTNRGLLTYLTQRESNVAIGGIKVMDRSCDMTTLAFIVALYLEIPTRIQ